MRGVPTPMLWVPKMFENWVMFWMYTHNYNVIISITVISKDTYHPPQTSTGCIYKCFSSVHCSTHGPIIWRLLTSNRWVADHMRFTLNFALFSLPPRWDVAPPGRKQQRGAVGLGRGSGGGTVVGTPAADGPGQHGGLQGRLAETVPVHQHSERAVHPLWWECHQGAHDVSGYRGQLW